MQRDARSQELSLSTLNALRGIENTDRIDAALYQDFETEAQKKARDGVGERWPVCTRALRQC